MAETIKARPRREREGFFEKYLVGHGIDIGCSDDPVTDECDCWDIALGNRDATFMEGVNDETYDFAYSSHTLEHLDRPDLAVQNWMRILMPRGFLILFIPHRTYYEKRRTLPSTWNHDHRTFWLPDRYEPPCTIGLIPFLVQHLGDTFAFVYCKVCCGGNTITDPAIHSDGEYSIECVIQKR